MTRGGGVGVEGSGVVEDKVGRRIRGGLARLEFFLSFILSISV